MNLAVVTIFHVIHSRSNKAAHFGDTEDTLEVLSLVNQKDSIKKKQSRKDTRAFLEVVYTGFPACLCNDYLAKYLNQNT